MSCLRPSGPSRRRLPEAFPTPAHANHGVLLTGVSSHYEFCAIATDAIPDLHLLDTGQFFARWRYEPIAEPDDGTLDFGTTEETGETFDGYRRIDNITDWALNKFVAHYGKKGVTKDSIFHYVYAVLHDPVYRETYALNLKREFPRIPFYPDFAAWAAWGEALMAMHIGYEEVASWSVERVDTPNPKRAEGTHPKPILKSVPEQGLVRVDEDTQITGIPREAWDYRLGNRSGLDWILDQYKEKTPKDPTIREKFNTYRFADYKEKVIDLLRRVTRVSVETVAITEAMKQAKR